jgi:hypothetical protein
MLMPDVDTPSVFAVIVFGVQWSNTRHVCRVWLAVLLQRSGIKEESSALGRHGGQPRS